MLLFTFIWGVSVDFSWKRIIGEAVKGECILCTFTLNCILFYFAYFIFLNLNVKQQQQQINSRLAFCSAVVYIRQISTDSLINLYEFFFPFINFADINVHVLYIKILK